jgi:hypothetical protein
VDLDDVGVETVDLWPRHAASAFRSCSDRDVPFWLALFASNGRLCRVAQLARALGQPWLRLVAGAAHPEVMRINVMGTGLVVGLYGACLLLFALYSNWLVEG